MQSSADLLPLSVAHRVWVASRIRSVCRTSDTAVIPDTYGVAVNGSSTLLSFASISLRNEVEQVLPARGSIKISATRTIVSWAVAEEFCGCSCEEAQTDDVQMATEVLLHVLEVDNDASFCFFVQAVSVQSGC